MRKSILAASGGLLMLGATASALATPAEALSRASAPMEASEEAGTGGLLLLIAIAIGTSLVIASGDGEPVSP